MGGGISAKSIHDLKVGIINPGWASHLFSASGKKQTMTSRGNKGANPIIPFTLSVSAITDSLQWLA
ncbi:hypothetical protein DWG24_13290 [Dickeya zeae]|uniref:Uncharacterized protein n=1 Tax=Dickeya zeae TaxID=204042 RepID=A0AAE6Z019_9GAMM|nr:hypothetical protein DWG24_13290 [Dickeya zeae]